MRNEPLITHASPTRPPQQHKYDRPGRHKPGRNLNNWQFGIKKLGSKFQQEPGLQLSQKGLQPLEEGLTLVLCVKNSRGDTSLPDSALTRGKEHEAGEAHMEWWPACRQGLIPQGFNRLKCPEPCTGDNKYLVQHLGFSISMCSVKSSNNFLWS